MIYGIDCSMRRVAIACPEQQWTTTTKLSAKVGHVDAMHQLKAFAGYVIPPDSSVWIESPVVAGARNIQSTLKAALSTGAVVAALEQSTVRMVAISSWKKAVCGYGAADKDGVAAWLECSDEVLSSACHGDQDCIDATCIALYGYLGEAGELL